jgi:hypothetical protein
MTSIVRLFLVSIVFLASILSVSPSSLAAAEGKLRWGLHVTLAARWLDPAETEAPVTGDDINFSFERYEGASAGVWARGWL